MVYESISIDLSLGTFVGDFFKVGNNFLKLCILFANLKQMNRVIWTFNMVILANST